MKNKIFFNKIFHFCVYATHSWVHVVIQMRWKLVKLTLISWFVYVFISEVV